MAVPSVLTRLAPPPPHSPTSLVCGRRQVGKVSHQPMQGGSARGVPLTAFTLLAFLAADEGSQFAANINRGIDYLVRNPPSDPYELAVVAYALALADHPGARGALARLDAMAEEQGERNGSERHCTLAAAHFSRFVALLSP